jgi:uncharacterized membrane protein YfcA
MMPLAGFLIATLIGMTGAGGGSLIVSVLVLGCGLPIAEAVGTSLVFGTIVKLLSTPAYLLRRQCSLPTLLRLLAGGLPGVITGTLLLRRLSTPGLEHAIFTIVGGTITLSAIASLWRLRPGAAAKPVRDRSRWLAWTALPIGLQVGFSSAGAGALTAATLMAMTPLATPVVIGTDLFFGLCLSATGSGLHLAMSQVNSHLAAQLLAGGIAGALAGPWLAMRIPVRAMRAALSLILCILGAELFWRGVAPLAG